MPKPLTISPEAPSSKSMAQRNVLRNHRNGRETMRATRSARARLTVFGTSSPRTTWIALNSMNEKERSQGTVGGHDALDQGSHGDFAERADRQAGEGDANLHTGNDAVQ